MGNLYTDITLLTKNNIFIYIVIIFLSIIIFNIIEIKLRHIFSIFIAFIIIYYLINKDIAINTTSSGNINNRIEHLNDILLYDHKYEIIDTYVMDNSSVLDTQIDSYLTPDNADLINFYYDIRDYAIYNPGAYRLSLIHANELIKLLLQLENEENKKGENIKFIVQSAYMQQKETLNELHSTIITLPSTCKDNNDYKLNMDKLQAITQSYIGKMIDWVTDNNPDNLKYYEYFLNTVGPESSEYPSYKKESFGYAKSYNNVTNSFNFYN
jgi:hypothetical protein